MCWTWEWEGVQSEVKLTKFNYLNLKKRNLKLVQLNNIEVIEPPGKNELKNLTFHLIIPQFKIANLHMIEKWGRIRPNPIYESQNLTNFTLVSGEVIEHSKPTSFEEAVNGPKSKNWKMSMEEEMQSLIENKTWKLVNKPKYHRIALCKWIYKLKKGNNPSDPPRYKA